MQETMGKKIVHDQLADDYDDSFEHAAYVQAIIQLVKRYNTKRYKLVEYSLEKAIIDRVRFEVPDINFIGPLSRENVELLKHAFPGWDHVIEPTTQADDGSPTEGQSETEMLRVSGYDIIRQYLRKLVEQPEIAD